MKLLDMNHVLKDLVKQTGPDGCDFVIFDGGELVWGDLAMDRNLHMSNGNFFKGGYWLWLHILHATLQWIGCKLLDPCVCAKVSGISRIKIRKGAEPF